MTVCIRLRKSILWASETEDQRKKTDSRNDARCREWVLGRGPSISGGSRSQSHAVEGPGEGQSLLPRAPLVFEKLAAHFTRRVRGRVYVEVE